MRNDDLLQIVFSTMLNVYDRLLPKIVNGFSLHFSLICIYADLEVYIHML